MSIVIPPGPPQKTPGLDHKDRIKIVTNSLLILRGKSGVIELERTDENQLTKLCRGEIIIELERIFEKNRQTFRIMRAGHTVKTAAKPASLQVGFSEPQYQWAQWREIPEKTPIVLALLGGFDNWCDAQLRKQNLTIRDLGEDSFRKVLNATADIYAGFELTSQPIVRLEWDETDQTRNKAARRQALEFLDSKDAVRRYSFQSQLGRVEIEIGVKDFLKFRDELLAVARDLQERAESAVQPFVAAPTNSFQAIDGLRWDDILVKFLDGHTARITAKEITETVDYKMMGFEDSRTHNPNTQWALLKILAANDGEITWEKAAAKGNVKKQKQLLSEKLQAYFGIGDDPFLPYRDEKAYRVKFNIKAEGD